VPDSCPDGSTCTCWGGECWCEPAGPETCDPDDPLSCGPGEDCVCWDEWCTCQPAAPDCDPERPRRDCPRGDLCICDGDGCGCVPEDPSLYCDPSAADACDPGFYCGCSGSGGMTICTCRPADDEP
jgi:hypothetical protein